MPWLWSVCVWVVFCLNWSGLTTMTLSPSLSISSLYSSLLPHTSHNKTPALRLDYDPTMPSLCPHSLRLSYALATSDFEVRVGGLDWSLDTLPTHLTRRPYYDLTTSLLSPHYVFDFDVFVLIMINHYIWLTQQGLYILLSTLYWILNVPSTGTLWLQGGAPQTPLTSVIKASIS